MTNTKQDFPDSVLASRPEKGKKKITRMFSASKWSQFADVMKKRE
jgi:hypothetical protein